MHRAQSTTDGASPPFETGEIDIDADTPAIVMSRRATRGLKVDVDSHQDESATGDLMPKAW